MQKLFSIILFLLVTIFGYSQNTDKALLNSYSKEELASIKKSEPEKYNLLVYAVEHGTYLGEFDAEKHGQLVSDLRLVNRSGRIFGVAGYRTQCSAFARYSVHT